MFHTRLLRPVRTDSLPGQVRKEPQPPGLLVEGGVEYGVKEILDQKQGRGGSDLYLVQWEGYQRPTWEPFDFVQDLIALDRWEARKADGHVPEGGRTSRRRRRRTGGIM